MKILLAILKKYLTLSYWKNYPKHFEEKRNRFKNVSIQKGASISPNSKIGEFTYIGHRSSVTKAIIGRYCSIAPNVTIGTGEHKINYISTSSLFYDTPYEILTEKDCIIGNDVWIGVNSVIRRGVKVGNGVVIGANSFVNSDLPDFAIAVGSPARVIKFRFSENLRARISESVWWNYDLQSAKKIISDLERSRG